MSNLRTASGRQLRTAALVETPLPIGLEASAFPGARLLGEDGQIYESAKNLVSGGYEWRIAAQGEPGPALELRKTLTEIQWRIQGSDDSWTTLVLLSDITGPSGPPGPPTPLLSFQGRVPTVQDLPEDALLGDTYLVDDTRDFWLWDGQEWFNTGPVNEGPEGPAGLDGEDGKPVQLRRTSTEIQWRLEGEPSWQTLVPLQVIQGPVGDIGPEGPAGPGFSFQGRVATVADLPPTAPQGHGYEVEATGDLYIFNGLAWVNAGPLQGPKGDQGDQGIQGPPGLGFSYQGSLESVGDLPTPSTQGFAYKIGTDLWIYNGTAWVNSGSLQGPKGDQGDQGPPGPAGPGFSYRGTVPTVNDLPVGVQGHAYKVEATSDLYIFNGLAWVNAGPFQGIPGERGDPGPKGDKGDEGEQGIQGPPGEPPEIIELTGVGIGTEPAQGWGLTIAAGICQELLSVTASGNTYSLDVLAGNEFEFAAPVNTATTVNLSNIASVPNGYTWRGVFSFSFTGGSVSFFPGNTGYSVKWDGGIAPSLTVGEVETFIVSATGGRTTIEIAAMRGRT